MKFYLSMAAALLLSTGVVDAGFADDAAGLQDPRAVEVLNNMAAYTLGVTEAMPYMSYIA